VRAEERSEYRSRFCVEHASHSGFVNAVMHDLRLVEGSSEASNDGAGCATLNAPECPRGAMCNKNRGIQDIGQQL
jgi:hypothetical protein